MKQLATFTPEPGLFPTMAHKKGTYSIAPAMDQQTPFPVIVRSQVFPDIHRLKHIIKQAKETGQDWPHVLLNVTTHEAYRPEVEGPLSIFMNIKGKSQCKVDNQMHQID